MGKHVFKSKDAKEAYFSTLSSLYSEINTVEQAGQFVEVNEENYEEVEKELKGYIDSGYILTGNGYPIKKGTEPYALFQKFFNGTEGVDYESKEKNFYFCLLGNKEQYYKMTVNNAGEPEVDNDPLKVEDIRRGVEPTQDELIAEDQALTEQVHQENVKDREVFGIFAEALRDAAKSTSRDSTEYKDIIKLLDTFKGKVDFTNSKEPAKSEWQKLDKEQRLALPMVLLKEKIDKYLEHKAKDGIKQNTFHKLAAVEILNQYIGTRIGQIKPKDFVFLGKPSNIECIKKEAKDEFDAINRIRESKQQPKLPDKSWSYDEIQRNLRISTEFNDDLTKNEQKEMVAVARCMNRMILNTQTKYEGEKCHELVEKLVDTRFDLMRHPLRTENKVIDLGKEAGERML